MVEGKSRIPDIEDTMFRNYISGITGERSSGGGKGMDWESAYIEKLNQDIHNIKTDIKDGLREQKQDINQKIDSFICELRDRDNQRHEEILSIRKETKDELAKIQANLEAAKSEWNSTKRWAMRLAIGVGLSFIGIVINILLKLSPQ